MLAIFFKGRMEGMDLMTYSNIFYDTNGEYPPATTN